MDEAQRERIEEYVNLSDRAVEPVFVGRQDLFGIAAKAARACATGHPDGQTLCVSGPPGVGKSAFIAALRGRALADWEGPPTLVVKVDPWRLHDARFTLERVAQALAEKDAARRTWKKMKAAGARVRGFSVLGLGGAIGPKDPKADFLAEGLAKALADAPEGFVLCLAVDEAQMLKPTPGGAANELLAMIHAGVYADYPMFVLLAGLSHLPDVVRPSISRLADGRAVRMQPLFRDESRTYLERTLDHLELRGNRRSRRRLIDWLVVECSGFPQHLRVAMTAVGEETLRTDSASLHDFDMRRLADDVGARRAEYYKGRLADLEDALPVIRALFGKWGPEGVRKTQAKDDAQDLIMEQKDGRMVQLRDAGLDSGHRLVNAMIARGLLASDGALDEHWRCLIPTLRGYVQTGMFKTASPPDLRRGGIGE